MNTKHKFNPKGVVEQEEDMGSDDDEDDMMESNDEVHTRF